MASAKKNKKKATSAGADENPKAKNADDASSTALLERFRRPAMKVREHRIQSCRADVRLAFANARLGVESVFGLPGDPERPANIKDIKAALPELSVKKVLDLPDLGRALMLAASKVVVAEASTGEIDAKLAVVRELRGPMLATAEVLAGRGLFPKEVVARIRSGSGKYDIASDGVALVDLYKRSAGTVRGAHPFTDEEIETLRAASEWLLDRLTPGGARERAPQKKTDAEDLRDRLWTLMLDRHSDLRAMGYYRFRDAFEKQTPRLQSRVGNAPRVAAGDSASNGATDEAQRTPGRSRMDSEPASMP